LWLQFAGQQLRPFQLLQCQGNNFIASGYLQLFLNETPHTRGRRLSVTEFPDSSYHVIQTESAVTIGVVDKHFTWKFFNN
jgi:hypothetical protein